MNTRFCSAAHLEVASHIVRADFGPIVATVCSWLLSHGAMPLPELVQGTGLQLSQVRNSLLILLQHNIIKAIARPVGAAAKRARGDAPSATAAYEASVDEVLLRRWFPRMLLCVRKSISSDAELVLQELLLHGRLSGPQLVEHAVSTYANANRCASFVAATIRRLKSVMNSTCAQGSFFFRAHSLSRLPALTTRLLPPPAVLPMIHPRSQRSTRPFCTQRRSFVRAGASWRATSCPTAWATTTCQRRRRMRR